MKNSIKRPGMRRLLLAVVCASFLGACSEPQQAVTAPPPPQPREQSFMVFFDTGSSTLSRQSQGVLQQAASAYKPGTSVAATGYTDTVGTPQFNMILSQRRAEAAKAALVKGGVPTAAITIAGKGEGDQLVKTDDGVAEPQNRRVVITMGVQQASLVGIGVFSDPAPYCKALSDKYRQYKNRDTEQGAAVAIDKCEKANYAEGIPVLEDYLIRDSIPLPHPGYRWPGRIHAAAMGLPVREARAEVGTRTDAAVDQQLNVLSIHVYPLLPGEKEPAGYAVYSYLIYTPDVEQSRSTAAVCGFLWSAATVTGLPNQDDRSASALYSLVQSAKSADGSTLQVADAVKRYHYPRAAAFLQRVNRPGSIYLVTYEGEPLPFDRAPDTRKLDVLDLGGLSPNRIYSAVLAYKSQLAPRGGYWKHRTLRQIGIQVAETLALLEKGQGVFRSLAEPPAADRTRIGQALQSDTLPPPACNKEISAPTHRLVRRFPG